MSSNVYRHPVSGGDDLEEDCAPAAMTTLPSLRDSTFEDIYSDNMTHLQRGTEVNTQQRCDSGYGDSAEYSVSFTTSLNSGTTLAKITEEESNSLHKDLQCLHLTSEVTNLASVDEGIDVVSINTEDEEDILNQQHQSQTVEAEPEPPFHWQQIFTQDEDGDT